MVVVDADRPCPWSTVVHRKLNLQEAETMMADVLRNVLLLEDAIEVAARLVGILSAWPNGNLLPPCRSVAEALAAIDEGRVDVLIADLQLPDGSGVEAIRALRKKNADAHAIVMSVLNDGPIVLEAIRAGATGYVIKDDESISVISAIEMVLEGKSPMSATIARLIVDSMHSESAVQMQENPDGAENALTPREHEVLTLISRGFSYREVAEMLDISAQTVPVHARNIYRKLEAKTKTEAVYLAHQRGLIDL